MRTTSMSQYIFGASWRGQQNKQLHGEARSLKCGFLNDKLLLVYN